MASAVCCVDLAVIADHAAEGRNRIARERALISGRLGIAQTHAARVGVLDDGAAHAFEIMREFGGGGGVQQIVEREFLASQNLRIAKRKAAPGHSRR